MTTPSFPYKRIERKTVQLSKDLRWRWRKALTSAVEIIKEERRISGVTGPVTERERALLSEIVLMIGDDGFNLISDHIDECVATGVVTATDSYVSGDYSFKEPSPVLIEELKRTPRFVDEVAMDFLKESSFEYVRREDENTMSRFRVYLLETLSKGGDPKSAARKMSADMGTELYKWNLIARTETAKALQFGIFQQSKELGSDMVFVSSQPSSCSSCKRLLEDRLFKRADIEGASNVGVKPSSWKAAIPLHPNCTCIAMPASDKKIKEVLGNKDKTTVTPSGVKL